MTFFTILDFSRLIGFGVGGGCLLTMLAMFKKS